jgi:hypothetical protein
MNFFVINNRLQYNINQKQTIVGVKSLFITQFKKKITIVVENIEPKPKHAHWANLR